MTLVADLAASTSFDLGPARALSCRECGHQVPLAAEFACPQCFGPLDQQLLLAEHEVQGRWGHGSMLAHGSDILRSGTHLPGIGRSGIG